LLTHIIEPRLGLGRLTFLYDYPASQASLARVRPGNPPLAERFELYLNGIELANGFHELADAAEQRTALSASNMHAPPAACGRAMDEHLLAALHRDTARTRRPKVARHRAPRACPIVPASRSASIAW